MKAIIIAAFFFFSTPLWSQSNDDYVYNIGDVYIYRYSGDMHGVDSWRYYGFKEVIDDTLIGQDRYFKILTLLPDYVLDWQKFRAESVFINYEKKDGNKIYRFQDNSAVVILDYDVSEGDTIIYRFPFPGSTPMIIDFVSYDTIFGFQDFVVEASIIREASFYTIKYAKKFGLLSRAYSSHGQSHEAKKLIGAKINGIGYGDTSLIGAKDADLLRKDFVLLQNYPNPFNQSTTITFVLNNRLALNVNMSVYDVLGKKIETLLKEDYILTGIHKVSWQPHNLSSGIYFCRLAADNFVSTKKLLFVK